MGTIPIVCFYSEFVCCSLCARYSC